MITNDSRSSVPLWSHMVRVRRVRTLSLQNIFALYDWGSPWGNPPSQSWNTAIWGSFLGGDEHLQNPPHFVFRKPKKEVLNPAPSLSPSLSQKQASFCPQTWNPSASCASSSRMVPQVVTSTPSHWDSLESRGHTMLPSCSYRSSCSRNSENKRPDCRPEYSLLAGPSV